MEIYDEYLQRNHESDIGSMLATDMSEGPMTIFVDMCHLEREEPELFSRLHQDAWEERRKWNASLIRVQQKVLSEDAFLVDSGELRDSCYVTLYNLPMTTDSHFSSEFPGYMHRGRLVQIKGNVIRKSASRFIESQREYICSKCKTATLCRADYSRMFVIEAPTRCPDAFGPNMCKGVMQPKAAQPHAMSCTEYQQFHLQELSSNASIPRTVIVTLEEDLVDSCEAGDCVVVCGVLQLQHEGLRDGQKVTARLVLRAISVYNDQRRMGRNFADEALYAQLAWQEIVEAEGEAKARERIVSSFSPKVLGMQCIKLAICVVLSSGSPSISKKSFTRENSHILLVGDPALGKSKLITFAAQVAPRSVYTTGVGSTKAGLTAAAIRENNEWHLEAGAMVLADGGVCCIDEFHWLTSNDKASIHECMEQQTLSIAKAGLLCSRSTRCSVIAAMNPKVDAKGKTEEEIEVATIGLSSPLLSRFDLIFEMKDDFDPEYDDVITSHLSSWIASDFSREDQDDQRWDKAKIQAHFLMVRDIQPILLASTKKVLEEYYVTCRHTYSNVHRGRTTMRLWNSLERLTVAHAKLMARTQATLVDATAIIFLVESSWGYGGILPSINIIKDSLPYPTEDMIDQVLFALSLTREDLGDPGPSQGGEASQLANLHVRKNGQEAQKRRQPEDLSPDARVTKRPAPVNSSQILMTANVRQDFLNSAEERQERPEIAFSNLLRRESLDLELDNLEDVPQVQQTRHAVPERETEQCEGTIIDGEQAGPSKASSINIFQENLRELRGCLETAKENGRHHEENDHGTRNGFLADHFRNFDCTDLELE